MIHADFAQSYDNRHQNETQCAYFGKEAFSIFTAICYTKTSEGALQQDSIVVVSEASEHDRATSMACLNKVIRTVEEKYDRSYSNVLGCSDGHPSQFQSRCVLCMLASVMVILTEKGLTWCYGERNHS